MRFNFFFWQSQSITCNSKEDVGKVRSETNIIKGMDEIRKKQKKYHSQSSNCIGTVKQRNFFLSNFQKKLPRVMGDLVKLTLLFETIEKMSDFDHFNEAQKITNM